VREIRMLRARWRELETEPRTRLNGHAGGNPGHSQARVLTGHRASSRPYPDLNAAASRQTLRVIGFGRSDCSMQLTCRRVTLLVVGYALRSKNVLLSGTKSIQTP
jgi:hypothetical protein